ncbi:response regulator transcription factor [Paenibacillus hunanensis]|uniref:response regulator transcription factor n=1 Tax=Paenibacillus hunanensis TaxID=539262 RepID=UPI002A6ABC2F|nr:response regulator transcription factor [Paenibacillus hunanensis]WPP41748.1 response regulator transcription factor [Paenibacillus hunanensis]
MQRLLLVDDEEGLLDMLSAALKMEGFQHIDTATNGKQALEYVASRSYDVIVLDVMLPDTDGYILCGKIREVTRCPILFLTARSTDLDMLTGLNVGGDDYITKPFKPLEVVARIKAKIRRERVYRDTNDTAEHAVYEYGFIKIHTGTAQLFVHGEEVVCTAREFQLLAFLAQHPNYIFSLQQLYERIWGMDSAGNTNTVMVHINRLRKKIEVDPNSPKILVNIRGLGYKFIPPKDEEA